MKALSRAEKVAWCRAEHPLWPEDELVPWVVAKEQLDLRLHEPPWAEPVALADCLADVQCPVRLVLGEVECGSLVDDAAVRELGVPFVRLAGAGHAVHRDQRAAFVRAPRSKTP
jgi:lipase